MIIIFDTCGGLCNQMFDINCGINFCIINNIEFSFRYCSFRYQLTNWVDEPFENLFDNKFLEKYNKLYIEYKNLNLSEKNTYNLNGISSVILFTDDYLNEINNIDKEFIVLKQFCGVYKLIKIIDNVYPYLLPSTNIMNMYKSISNNIINEEYNFIHYRYENDFTDYFKVEIELLKPLILRIKPKFKNPNLKIYIATTNIKQLIDLNDTDLSNIILTKNEDDLINYNFEERAFIDYMFGLHSNEVFGHNKSSFSLILSSIKGTQNFYNY